MLYGIESDRWGYFAKLINKESFLQDLELCATTGMPAFA